MIHEILGLFWPFGILFVLLGTLYGMFIGLLPGVGGVIGLALLIPLTYGLDTTAAFMLLGAAVGGAGFSGSITAILLHTPGSAPNAATLLDGYPMTRNGEAGRAIGASAAASALGAIVGITVLVASLPVMLKFVLLFGSPEIFWLGVWGLTFIPLVISDRPVAGLISAGIGLLIAMHGRSLFTGSLRWSYDLFFLEGGIGIVPALIGIFAISEMLNIYSEGLVTGEREVEGRVDAKGKWQGIRDVFHHKRIFFQSALIGVLIGTIPGVGGTAANYIAYFQAVQSSDDPEAFGTGDVRGVIASEASNDAKEGGSFIPTLGIGIPGSASMAIFFSAFLLHGIEPGPLLMANNFDLVLVIIVSLLVSNVLTSLIGLSITEQLVKVTQVDEDYLIPAVIALSLLGSFASQNVIYNVLITVFFGLVGFAMIKVGMSRVPVILGVVLGPIVERNFVRSLTVARGDLTYLVDSTVSKVLVGIIVVSFSYPYVVSMLQRRYGLMGGE